jgi:hypothetical protein
MTDSQYINKPILTGQVGNPKPGDLATNGTGVNFTSVTDSSITITFPPGKTPILFSVTVPPINTNVDRITVTIKLPNGTTIVRPISSTSGNTVANFPLTPLPEGSIIIVTVTTSDGQAPVNVTLSVIACFTSSTAATVVSTGTPAGTPSATTVTTGTGPGAQTTLIISTTAAGRVTGISSTKGILTQSGFERR